jgi:hypothetical protein
MIPAHEQLIDYLDDPHFWKHSRGELEPLWLEGANRRLSEQRDRIPVLGRLAEDAAIKEIRSLDDLVPLLFSHSNYKSYPEAFIAKGRWEHMNRWLDTLSSVRVEGVDVEGVRDQDDWLERLHAHDHMVFVSSGTTGKNSFLPATPLDRDFSLRVLDEMMTWTHGKPNQDRAVFVLGPKYGPNRAALHLRKLAEACGRPEATFFLTDEPMRVSDLSRMAELRRKIAAGSAKPSEVATFERDTAARQEEMATRLDEMIDKLLEHRREPMIICGFWAQCWTIMEQARARGLRPGEFHPDTVLAVGGGNKGVSMPEDFKDQILAFFGLRPENVPSGGYGMSELSAPLHGIEGRYRPLPWVIPLILDDSGEALIHRDDGLAEGRFAFLDLALEGRWGGVVTGDHVVADFSTPNVSIVADSITRYSAFEGGDDKLTCAGTIDAYVRGVME